MRLARSGLAGGDGLGEYLLRISRTDLVRDGAYGVWLLKTTLATLGVPLFCTGAALGVWLDRSAGADARLESFSDRLAALIYRFQTQAGFPANLLFALAGTLALLAFAFGNIVGTLLLGILLWSLMQICRPFAFVFETSRLRRILGVLGFLLLTTSFVIKVAR